MASTHPTGRPDEGVAAPDGVTVSRTMIDTLLAHLGRVSWSRESGGATALVTGAGSAGLNAVWVHGPRVDEAAVDRLLAGVRRAGVPYHVQVAPGLDEVTAAPAARHGLHRAGRRDLMTRSLPAGYRPADAGDGLAVREVAGGDDLDRFRDVAVPAFGDPPGSWDAVLTEGLLADPARRSYVGSVDGTDVVTATALGHAETVGVFDVATAPAYRGCGFGSAMVEHVLAAGRAGGARWAWLAAEPDHRGLYERLGFRTAETWTIWTPAS